MPPLVCKCGAPVPLPPGGRAAEAVCPACGATIAASALPRPEPRPPAPKIPRPEIRRVAAAGPAPAAGPWKALAIIGVAVAFISLAVTLYVATSGKSHETPTSSASPPETEKLLKTLRDQDEEIAVLKQKLREAASDPERAAPVAKRIQELETERKKAQDDLEQERAQRGRLEKRVEELEQAAHGASKPADPGPQPKKEKGLADLVEKCGPSVVLLRTDIGAGAGFFITAGGMAATNHHVISGSRTIQVHRLVTVQGKKQRQVLNAVAYAVDMKNDLALVQVQGLMDTAPVLELETGAPRVGDAVLTIGNPGLQNLILESSASSGIVSSLAREIDGKTYLQTTTPINPGNSGGPLLNMSGRVIGIVTAKAKDLENVGFAVPVEKLDALYKLRDGEFRVQGAFADWEMKHGLKFTYDSSAAIAVNGSLTKMVLDEENNRILALDYENNSLLIISLTQRKVEESIFVGSEPENLLLVPGGRTVWVSNSASKNFVLVDLSKKKVTETIQVGFSPHAFVLSHGYIWAIAAQGNELYAVSVADKKDYPTNRVASALAYISKKDLVVAVWGGGALELIDASRYGAAAKELSRIKQADFKQRNALTQEMQKMVKSIQPPVTGSNYSTLLVDNRNGRVFYNRAAFSTDRLDAMEGVFKPNPYSLSSDPAVRIFMAKYPQLDQIMSFSPDGRWAVNGTHVFDVTKFTVHKELPIPTVSMTFSKDSKTLYFFDVLNRVIAPFEVEK